MCEGAESLTRWGFGSVHSGKYHPARTISDISLHPTVSSRISYCRPLLFGSFFWKILAEMKGQRLPSRNLMFLRQTGSTKSGKAVDATFWYHPWKMPMSRFTSSPCLRGASSGTIEDMRWSYYRSNEWSWPSFGICKSSARSGL